jgi:uncharacterized membrane protein
VWVVFLLLSLAGAALTVVGLMGLLGKLAPNAFAGIRTPYTRSSPERWYATHRAASPYLVFGGVAVVSAALAFLPFAIAGRVSDGLGTGVAVVLGVVVLVAAFWSWRTGTAKAKREVG